jgi:hypothetical protein
VSGLEQGHNIRCDNFVHGRIRRRIAENSLLSQSA